MSFFWLESTPFIHQGHTNCLLRVRVERDVEDTFLCRGNTEEARKQMSPMTEALPLLFSFNLNVTWNRTKNWGKTNICLHFLWGQGLNLYPSLLFHQAAVPSPSWDFIPDIFIFLIFFNFEVPGLNIVDVPCEQTGNFSVWDEVQEKRSLNLNHCGEAN